MRASRRQLGLVFHTPGMGRARNLTPPLAILMPLLLFLLGLSEAGVAQLVEHLICNQRVGGSIPSASSTAGWVRQGMRRRFWKLKLDGLVSLDTSPFCVFADSCLTAASKMIWDMERVPPGFRVCICLQQAGLQILNGQDWDGWVSG